MTVNRTGQFFLPIILVSSFLCADTGLNFFSRPSFSPNGTMVVFSYSVSIYTVNIDKGKTVRLTKPERNVENNEPIYSADGKKIAYVRNEKGSFGQIHVMNSDGSNDFTLTSNKFANNCPSFSQDGKSLFFIRGTSPRKTSMGGEVWDNWGVYKIDLATKKEQKITDGFSDLCCLSPSPDSKRLLFASSGGTFLSDIYARDLEESTKVILFKETNIYYPYPAYSPDGKSIVYVSRVTNPDWRYSSDHDNFALFLMDKDGKNDMQLTKTNTRNYAPAFSTDGRRIVCISRLTEDEDSGFLFLFDMNKMEGRKIEIPPCINNLLAKKSLQPTPPAPPFSRRLCAPPKVIFEKQKINRYGM